MIIFIIIAAGVPTERKHWALRPQKPLGLIRDGEVVGAEFFFFFIKHLLVTLSPPE